MTRTKPADEVQGEAAAGGPHSPPGLLRQPCPVGQEPSPAPLPASGSAVFNGARGSGGASVPARPSLGAQVGPEPWKVSGLGRPPPPAEGTLTPASSPQTAQQGLHVRSARPVNALFIQSEGKHVFPMLYLEELRPVCDLVEFPSLRVLLFLAHRAGRGPGSWAPGVSSAL